MATKIRGTGWSAMLIRSITLRAPPPSTDQPPVVPFRSQGGRGWTGWLAGVGGLELRNVVAKYPFERSHRSPGIRASVCSEVRQRNLAV
jgi:hypothetical protein